MENFKKNLIWDDVTNINDRSNKLTNGIKILKNIGILLVVYEYYKILKK